MLDVICEHTSQLKACYLQGQCCCAGSRTYVHERVYDEFVEKAKARALKRVVGDPFKQGVEQGPQVLSSALSPSPFSSL